MRPSRRGPRSGVASAWVVTALVALLGAAALVVDLGRLVLAAQRCQDVADSAALAAARELPSGTSARTAALKMVAANNSEGCGWPVQCEDSDLQFFPPGSSPVSGEPALGPYAHALRVTVHAQVDYSFARILGIRGATAQRSATVLRAPVEGVPIATMWIAHGTDLSYGQRQQMLMADGPHYAGIPGSFGFLESPPGCTADWFSLLQGYGLSVQDVETSFVKIGDSLFAKTGVDVGHLRRALKQDQGNARLERGTSGEFAGDTFTDYDAENPRIMLVPLVSYVGGTGAGAEFRIEKFGAFWLEEVTTGHPNGIWGRFIEYDMPGGDPNSSLTTSSGVFATKLVR